MAPLCASSRRRGHDVPEKLLSEENRNVESRERERDGGQRRWLKAVLSGAVIVALTVSMLYGLTRLVERKGSRQLFASFFEQEEDFDVLFLGTSRTIDGISILDLWNDYGIVSYNLAVSGAILPAEYWELMNALDYTSPKLVVVDGCYLAKEFGLNMAKGASHACLDAFPLSITKIRAVLDLTENMSDRMEFLWDFSLYHDRWEELSAGDFKPGKNVCKGGRLSGGAAAPLSFPDIGPDKMLEEDTKGVLYLEKIIEACQERDIDVILTYMPYPAGETEQMEANRLCAIAEEYGETCLNFLRMDVVDYSTDLRNSYTESTWGVNGHLNPSGGQKITEYIGNYIRDNYDIPDRRGDADYQGWYDDYVQYTDYKIQVMNNQTELMSYFTLLYDKHISCCLYLADSGIWRAGGVYYDQLRNLGIDSDQLFADSPTLVVLDRMGGTVSYVPPGGSQETAFGTVMFNTSDDVSGIQINGLDCMSVDPAAVAGVAVIDNATGNVATSSCFSETEKIG